MTAWKTAALAAALLTISCGDRGARSGEQEKTAPPPAPASVLAGTEFSARVVLSDSALAMSVDSFAPGQVTLLVRNDGSQPELLRVEGPNYHYPPAGQTGTMLVPHDSVVYLLHLGPGTYRLHVDGSALAPTSFVVQQ